ncbi:MAG TPA: sigma-70 family RNA polymerase sigma factor [Candidatus Baltobacteraceae bacterium]|nr:sigma-70 family RNA polymerase sigma factor [Candidatus Baltobacteraceae bacterium]
MEHWAPGEMVSAAMSGGEAERERLIAAIWPRCFRLALTVIGDRDLAQDAAQEACVIVHRKLRGLRSAQSFESWLYRIVMREASRARRRNRPADVRGYEEFRGEEPAAAIDVWSALARLAPELRDVTVLFYFRDLKSDEIASILRIPHATVRTRLGRARERLRAILGNYLDDPNSEAREVKQHAL